MQKLENLSREFENFKKNSTSEISELTERISQLEGPSKRSGRPQIDKFETPKLEPTAAFARKQKPKKRYQNNKYK